MKLKKFENFFIGDSFNKKIYEQYGRDEDDDDDDLNDDGGTVEPYVPKQLEPGQEWWN